MAHVQEQILAAVVAVLVAAATPAGANVFLDRLDPLASTQVPAILVEESPSGERSAVSTVHGLDERQYDVRITCVVAHATLYAANARELGLQVEKALCGAAGLPVLLPLAKGGYGLSTSRLITSGEGDEARAAREQTWRFTYYVRSETPDVPA